MNLEEIIKSLNETEVYLKNDVGPVIHFYYRRSIKNSSRKRRLIGFFGTLRLLFPVLDCLGSFYIGNINSTEAAIKFLRDYMGTKINPDYKKVGPFVYLVYRHGLAHQDKPKLFTYKYKHIHKLIGLTDPRNSGKGHLKFDGEMIGVDGSQLYKDLCKAFKYFKRDINKNPVLQDNFAKARAQMDEPWTKTKYLKKYKSLLTEKDFEFLKKSTH